MQLFALLLLSQAAPPPPAAQDVKPEDRVSIEGQVINAITGAPVRKAEVHIRDTQAPGSVEAQTDQAGQFSVQGLIPSSYTISAAANGYTSSGYERVELSPKTRKTGVILKLTPQGVITGRILDEDGDPVSGVHVVAYPARIRRRAGGANTTNESSTHTNDLGEFRLARLTPGSYLISATASSGGWSDGPPISNALPRRRQPIPTFFPAALDVAAAQAVKVAAAQEIRGIDIRLRSARTVTVSGRVQWGDLPPRRARVLLKRQASSYGTTSHANTQADGSFSVADVIPGEYSASLEPDWSQDKDRKMTPNAYLAFTVGESDVTGLTLVPRLPVRISGNVTAEGQPPDWTKFEIRLISQAPEMDYFFSRYGHAQVKTGGDFESEPLSVGIYRVGLSTERPYYIKSATYNGRDILTGGLDSSVRGELAIALASDSGSVTSSVTWPEKDKPDRISVIAWPKGAADQLHRVQLCRIAPGKSSCDLTALAPGDYKIAAFAGTYSDLRLTDEPAFLHEMEEKAESLSVSANSKQSKALQLIRLDVD